MRRPEPPPDSEALVRRAIAGEPGAFGALYERHVDAVFAYVRFRVNDGAAAADLTQDVFVSAFRGISRLQHPERFGAWLIRIAHNAVLNHRRAQARRLGGGPHPEAAPEPPGLGPDPAGEVERRLTGEQVAVAAAGLTEDQRQVLALRFVAGLSLAESAAVLGRSEDAVKKLQRRALAALRRCLGVGEGEGLP